MVRSCKGFTLIETLTAMGVLGIIFMAFPAVLVTTLRTNSLARSITTATTLAQDKCEELRNTSYDTLASGTDSATPGQGVTYTRTWTVAAGPTATTKKVTINVNWAAQTSRRVVLTTIFTP